MIWFVKLRKKLRDMSMKRKNMKGRSARHGKAQSTYQKYDKKPHRYSAGYYDWKRAKMASIARTGKYADQARDANRA